MRRDDNHCKQWEHWQTIKKNLPLTHQHNWNYVAHNNIMFILTKDTKLHHVVFILGITKITEL